MPRKFFRKYRQATKASARIGTFVFFARRCITPTVAPEPQVSAGAQPSACSADWCRARCKCFRCGCSDLFASPARLRDPHLVYQPFDHRSRFITSPTSSACSSPTATVISFGRRSGICSGCQSWNGFRRSSLAGRDGQAVPGRPVPARPDSRCVRLPAGDRRVAGTRHAVVEETPAMRIFAARKMTSTARSVRVPGFRPERTDPENHEGPQLHSRGDAFMTLAHSITAASPLSKLKMRQIAREWHRGARATCICGARSIRFRSKYLAPRYE